ncbi:23S rRNA (pseudouridine1915-N3)-methyltransferase [Flavobacteriaceae bacterium MAR_2010_188]|nr:23S rRNA (pseudouridine1915-N3)-methyltransferase [Flavobacteriaceae bacterium MAR_2010_188]
MEITLVTIGKTDNAKLVSLISDYQKRLSHYIKFNIEEIPDIKNSKTLSEEQQKKIEGEKILNQLKPTDRVVLLDEKGKHFKSKTFAQYLQKQLNSGVKRLVFIVGGPYGFSDEIYAKAEAKIALSSMTFSHQMVRLFFVEQLYRGFTILKNEPYHHE